MQTKKKIIVIGGDSLIGSALVSYLQFSGECVTATTRRKDMLGNNRIYLDLSDGIDKWPIFGPFSVAIICAAITKIDTCALDPGGSLRVNVEAIRLLTDSLSANGTFILFLSSNQVFDGLSPYPSPEDPVCPVNEYGRQKVMTEKLVLSNDADRVGVLRLTKVMGSRNPLLEDWIMTLKKGQPIKPFDNMSVAPIPLSSVLSVIRLMIDNRTCGIYHLSGDRDLAYSEVAMTVARILKVSRNLVQPISFPKAGLAGESFPVRTALNMESLKSAFGIMPPDVDWTIKKATLYPDLLNGRARTVE